MKLKKNIPINFSEFENCFISLHLSLTNRTKTLQKNTMIYLFCTEQSRLFISTLPSHNTIQLSIRIAPACKEFMDAAISLRTLNTPALRTHSRDRSGVWERLVSGSMKNCTSTCNSRSTFDPEASSEISAILREASSSFFRFLATKADFT